MKFNYDKNDVMGNMNSKMINLLILTLLFEISKLFISNPITLFGIFIFNVIIMSYILLGFMHDAILNFKYIIKPYKDFINNPYIFIVLMDSKRRKAVYHFIRCRLHLLRIIISNNINNRFKHKKVSV